MQKYIGKYSTLTLLLCFGFLLTTAQRRSKDILVKVQVTVKTETDQKGLIVYNRERPLQISDFKGKPDAASPGIGATYSGILMETEGKMESGVFITTVSLTIYFDPSKSWMKKEGKDERVLGHEQNHFDLTAIKACALANAIAGGSFNYRNLKQQLRHLHSIHMEALQRVQHDYDRETRHGTVKEAQAEWSARIASDLAAATCF